METLWTVAVVLAQSTLILGLVAALILFSFVLFGLFKGIYLKVKDAW